MRAARHFALRHSAELVLAPWLRHLPADHFHTVLVPRSREDPDLLWRRFGEAVSISPDVAPQRPEFARESLGYASATLVGRFNQRFGDTRAPAYRAVVRRFLCEEVLTPLASAESAIPVTRQVYLAGIRQNHRNRQALLASGVPVTGDLDDLPVVPDEARLASLPTTVEPPDTEQYLTAAETAITALRKKTRTWRKKGGADQHARKAGTAESRAPGAEWRATSDPTAAATEAVTTAVREALRAYGRGRGGAGDEPRTRRPATDRD